MQRIRLRRNSGQMAVLAYVAVAVVMVLGGSLVNHSFNAHLNIENQETHADVFYMAEGGLEDALSQFSQAIANFQIDANTDRYPATGSIITTFSSGATASSVITEAETAPRTVADPDGTSIFVKNYEVTTTVQHPTSSMSVTLHQIVTRRLIYTFQHAVFYDKDLEWLPGPDMTLAGRVHSNQDIYLGTHNTLTVDSEYLRAAGDLYNRRKDSSTSMAGSVEIKKAGTDPAEYPAMAGLDSDDSNWTTESQTRWNGTVQTSDHEVPNLAVPTVGSINPGEYYNDNANVEIINNGIKRSGLVLTESATPCGTCVPLGTISSTTTFYNNREAKYVKMTEIDMQKLAGYDDGDAPGSPSFPNQLPSNGLMYVTRNDATGTQQPGVRLTNGSQIHRSGGLTVVSNDPVYVQGDYNTVQKEPTAVIADAVNLLSNDWSDSNSTSSVDSRVAAATTINTAFIAGIDDTIGSDYNGGLENYPRFHETWSGKELTITGSFVSLWNSVIATGKWEYGNPQYKAPIRTWSYDTSFASGTSMPPFTPFAVEMEKGAWWRD